MARVFGAGNGDPLNRLVTDKEIQGKQSIFRRKIWLGLGPACLGFDRFGFGLETPCRGCSPTPAVDVTAAFMISVSPLLLSAGHGFYVRGAGTPADYCGIGCNILLLQMINSSAGGETAKDFDAAAGRERRGEQR